MSMVGKTYLLRGEPVVVLARWRSDRDQIAQHSVCNVCGAIDPVFETHGEDGYCTSCGHGGLRPAWSMSLHEKDVNRYVSAVFMGFCPRNVLIEYADGHRSVRPFRGLRRSAATLEPA